MPAFGKQVAELHHSDDGNCQRLRLCVPYWPRKSGLGALGSIMGKMQGIFAAMGLLLSVSCQQSVPATTADAVEDLLVVQDETVDIAPDVTPVFDPNGALGLMKAPPVPFTDFPPSRFPLQNTFTVGQIQPGVWVLPNGRLLTPAGKQVELKSFPLGLLAHPNGKWVYVSNDREDGATLQVYDIASDKLIQTTPLEGLYRFLTLSPDGLYLYASGGPLSPSYRLKIGGDGTLELNKTYTPVDGFFAIALSPDGKILYGVTSYSELTKPGLERFAALDVETGKEIFGVDLAAKPYELQVSPDGKFAYTLSWRAGVVQRIDLANPTTPTETDSLVQDFNAQGLALSPDGKRLWVSLVEADEIVEIDPLTMKEVRRIPVGLAPLNQPLMAPRGRDPGLMVLSPDGKRLYVVCAMSNDVSVIDTEKNQVVGEIPTGWYPSGIALSQDGKTLFVGNAKGTGTPPWDGSTQLERSYLGTMSIIPIPDDTALAQGQKDVLDNMIGVSGHGRLPQPAETELVLPKTGASTVIKHVVYIMRENKTFDVELGDIATQVNGDVKAEPKYALFGEEFTPNLHKLAAEFCLLDNFYTDGDYSATGHGYAVATKPSDYIEKFYGLDSKGAEPAWNVGGMSSPGQGFLFANVLAYGYTAADFGEIVGVTQQTVFDEVAHPDFPGVMFNLGVHDEEKADFVVQWIAANPLPTFTFILLPNNHTCCGGTPDKPSPRSMVADNDVATGKVVEALSKSPDWHETVVFIFEDDPQDGGDSVAYHRSPLLVISPWVKRHTVLHTHHATGSIHATMERMLDITPLTELDGFASPIYGCFTDKADDGLYTHRDRLYPETLNKDEKGKKWTTKIKQAWNEMKFDKPDQNRGLGRVLWQMYKGTPAPWPNWLMSRLGEEVDADD